MDDLEEMDVGSREYWVMPPHRPGSCFGCARREQNLACLNINCDGTKGTEFILIDRTEQAFANYIANKLTT